MDTQELKAKRKQLIVSLSKAVNEFESATGCRVNRLTVEVRAIGGPLPRGMSSQADADMVAGFTKFVDPEVEVL